VHTSSAGVGFEKKGVDFRAIPNFAHPDGAFSKGDTTGVPLLA